MPSFYREGPPTPPYVQGLVGDLSEKTERTSFQRPQDWGTLQSFYRQSLGNPDLLGGVGTSAIAALFTDAVRASQQMARERGGAGAGERGAAPGASRTTGFSSGVQAQHLERAMRPLQERIAQLQAKALFERELEKERGLAALFSAASGPVSEDRYTSYKTRPSPDTMPEVRYPSQSMGAAGGSIGGGGGRGGGGGGGASSFDPYAAGQGGGGASGDFAPPPYIPQPSEDWWRRGRPSPDEPPGGGPSPLPGSLPDFWPSPDEPPGGGPTPLPEGDEWEYTMGGTGSTQFRARRPKGSTGSYGRF